MDTTLSSQREPATAQDISEGRCELPQLTTAQQTALEWLVGGGNITEAAQVAGVARQTVSGWLNKDPDFRRAYQLWRQQALQAAQGKLTALAEIAVQTLAQSMGTKLDTRTAQFVVKQLGIGKEKPGSTIE